MDLEIQIHAHQTRGERMDRKSKLIDLKPLRRSTSPYLIPKDATNQKMSGDAENETKYSLKSISYKTP